MQVPLFENTAVRRPREGDYYRISDETLLNSISTILVEVRRQCGLGFGQVPEDERRIVELQNFIQEVSHTRGRVEHDPTEERYRRAPKIYDPRPLHDKVNKVYKEAVKSHSRAFDKIDENNVMRPYSQKLESLIQMLLHEIVLYSRLTEVHEDCPVFNSGLAVLTAADLDEMEKGLVGPIDVYGDGDVPRIWWDRLRMATPESVLLERKVMHGDPAFAISYKHKGVGGIGQRMQYEEWEKLNNKARLLTKRAHFYEYFLWVDIEYSRNRNKTDSWAKGGIAPYVSCFVLTTTRDIADSYWCRLERLLASLSLGLDSLTGEDCDILRSPHRDKYTVLKFAAQTILLSNMIRANRIREEDASGLIHWALSCTYKQPEVTVGDTLKPRNLAVGYMEVMSWWCAENVMPGVMAKFREQKRHLDSQTGRSKEWHGVREWVSQHIQMRYPENDACNSEFYKAIYQRVTAESHGVDDGMHVVQLVYRHFDGSEAAMVVFLQGCDVYEAHLVDTMLGTRVRSLAPVPINMLQVSWHGACTEASPERCDRCDISQCLNANSTAAWYLPSDVAGTVEPEISRVLSRTPRPGERKHTSHAMLGAMCTRNADRCEEMKRVLVHNTIGFERYEKTAGET